MSFGLELASACDAFGPLCVGIDTHEGLLKSWGLKADVDGLREFSQRCVEAFSSHVAAVKPQVSFYERFGSAGFEVLEETLAALREAGTLVISDAKRGDIGSTMAGYAEAWLGTGPLESDALTVNPYLGIGALAPVFEKARERGKGVFVLAATSNPEARELQSAIYRAPELTVAQAIVDECAVLNQAQGEEMGDVGVVVGATLSNAPELGHLNGPVLMPGVGAQGASFADAQRLAGGSLAVANVSRGVLKAGPQVADLRKAIDKVVTGSV